MRAVTIVAILAVLAIAVFSVACSKSEIKTEPAAAPPAETTAPTDLDSTFDELPQSSGSALDAMSTLDSDLQIP